MSLSYGLADPLAVWMAPAVMFRSVGRMAACSTRLVASLSVNSPRWTPAFTVINLAGEAPGLLHAALSGNREAPGLLVRWCRWSGPARCRDFSAAVPTARRHRSPPELCERLVSVRSRLTVDGKSSQPRMPAWARMVSVPAVASPRSRARLRPCRSSIKITSACSRCARVMAAASPSSMAAASSFRYFRLDPRLARLEEPLPIRAALRGHADGGIP